MKNILVIGAGRSSSSLIRYLLDHAQAEGWCITVGDLSLVLAQQKTGSHPRAKAIRFDISDPVQRGREIGNADLVISMLPATMHMEAAKDCVRLGRHLVTASYVSKEMAALDDDARRAGVVLLNEIGLDPGIDHMSAMKIIGQEKHKGNAIVSFRSYCGGLIDPGSNDNPWGYKFTWNPRNVVLAGQGGDAVFIRDGKMRSIPYERLFEETETVKVNGQPFEAYANRDSLSYRQSYGLENISTMLRGTLRMPGFCAAWNELIRLGLTNDSDRVDDAGTLSWKKFTAQVSKGYRVTNKQALEKLEWLGIFSDTKVPLSSGIPARVLQALLEEKWKLKPNDKDMIVMQHEFGVQGRGSGAKKIISSLVVKGEDPVHTAMAKTVGLPAAIGAKLVLQDRIPSRGVLIPTTKEIYSPVLAELEKFSIIFSEKES